MLQVDFGYLFLIVIVNLTWRQMFLRKTNLYDWHVALLEAVPWVCPFFSEFYVYSAVIQQPSRTIFS